jgi:hypothetical protein
VATPVSPTSVRLETPTGSLILRVWWESGSPHPFRARLLSVDPDGRTANLGTTADPAAALAMIQRWMEEFVSKAKE